MRRRSLLLWMMTVASCVVLRAPAWAMREGLPMGYFIRKAGLIVLAYNEAGKNEWSSVINLHVKEVLKGDASLKGKVITLTHRPGFSTADACIPNGAIDVAVLLPEDWSSTDRWPVMTVYETPSRVAALRTLIPICEMTVERERILALRDLLVPGDADVGDLNAIEMQFFAELRDMTDPGNFQLILDFYPIFNEERQRKLIDLVRDMGDLRGVSLLIEALLSGKVGLRGAAALGLAYAFPGAPGVTEAFQEVLKEDPLPGDAPEALARERDQVRRCAIQYLAERSDDRELQESAKSLEWNWEKEKALLAAGDTPEGRDALLKLMEDPRSSEYSRMTVAGRILEDVGPEERQRVKSALWGILLGYAKGDSHDKMLQAAQAFRALRDPDGLDALLQIMKATDFETRVATQVATMAVREMGTGARDAASAKVLSWLKEPTVGNVGSSIAPVRYFMELAWIGSASGIREALNLLQTTVSSELRDVDMPLLRLNEQDDEVVFLTGFLDRQMALNKTVDEVTEWVIFRLGDLGDARAVPLLVRFMAPWHKMGDGISPHESTVQKALLSIPGQVTESEMMKLLKTEGRPRLVAIEVLSSLQKERFLPELRGLLQIKDHDVRDCAIRQIGRWGTPEDIQLLLPFADYWKDRSLHAKACMAVSSLRERHHYDINGPIQKGPAELGKSFESRLISDDPQIRMDALSEWEKLDPDAAQQMVPFLIQCLGNHPEGKADIAHRAGEALLRAQAVSIPLIISFIERPDTVSDVKDLSLAQGCAMGVLEKAGLNAGASLGALLPYLKKRNSFLQMHAIDAMCAVAPEDTRLIPELIGMIPDEDVGYVACHALSKMGPVARDAVPALVDVLESPPPGTDAPIALQAAVETLGRIGPDALPAVPALMALFNYTTRYIRSIASEALSRIGAPAIPALVTALSSEDFLTRQGAVSALGDMKPRTPEVRSALLKALNDDNSVVRDNAYVSLLDDREDPAIQPVLEAFRQGRKEKDGQIEDKKREDFERTWAKEEILASIPVEGTEDILRVKWAVTERTWNDGELFIIVHSSDTPEYCGDIAAVYLKQGGGYRLMKRIVSDGSYFEEPEVFRFVPSGRKESEQFLHISEVHQGTAGVVDEHLFHVNPNGALDDVAFTPASEAFEEHLQEGETVWGPGENGFGPDGLTFSFCIWQKDDAMCCPTAGRVSGTYKMQVTESPGSQRTYSVGMDTHKREPMTKE